MKLFKVLSEKKTNQLIGFMGDLRSDPETFLLRNRSPVSRGGFRNCQWG